MVLRNFEYVSFNTLNEALQDAVAGGDILAVHMKSSPMGLVVLN